MAKPRRGWRIFFVFCIIILAIILLINAENISYLFLPKYECYTDETGFYVINIDGVLYKEIREKMYNDIDYELTKKGIYTSRAGLIGGINYSEWKYKIYGNKNAERRILLLGRDAYTFHDANYPEVYFCREDVLQMMGHAEP
ncbi:MAG: hypothetical protein GXW96_04130 [Christensenellaceae bacterium]|nr:hypothetical protein [Christensenellaceae bacterium]